MGERLVAWRSKPSEAVVQNIRSLARKRMFLVHRPGPTCFVVQEEGCEVSSKVLIGSRVTCSCKNGKSGDACIHKLFVMLKVLGIPPSNPIIWQGSLLDRELEELIQCGNRMTQHTKCKRVKKSLSKKESGGVQPRKIEPDERCPICFDALIEANEKELLSCGTCGNHIHGRCIYVWARHQESLDRMITCPLCRGDWGEVKWSRAYACDKRGVPTTTNARDRNKDTFYGCSCGKCSLAPLQGKRYSCAICRHFDLCQECFDQGVHSVHPFVVQSEPGGEAVPAPRGEADLENFEFKAPSSGKAGKARVSVRPLPLKERAGDNNEQRRTSTSKLLGSSINNNNNNNNNNSPQENLNDTLSGMSIEAQGLNLMAVGTSVKSTPKVKTSTLQRKGRLRGSFSRSRTASESQASRSPDGVLDALGITARPLSVQTLGLGIVGQRTDTRSK